MSAIILRQLTKRFGQTTAVDRVDIDVPDGSLFFLLGPSGCGKTTLLRMLAGFIDPDGGTIRFGERDVTHWPANKRNCGMVFQSYALWPHMSVAQNVAFGLQVRKVARDETRQRVERALKTVQMMPYIDRKPNELSGGQQQRVALARALVVEPTVLLLDEPLSNLDAKLRLEMRSQIREICKQAQITAVYVTHDQKEALSMADHLAVMREGRVVQLGAPRELYNSPASRFVADFLGETNFVVGEIVGREDDVVVIETAGGRIRSRSFPKNLPDAGSVTCSLRPEALHVVDRADAEPNAQRNVYAARRTETIYLGEMAQHQLVVDDKITLKVFELNPRMQTGPDGMVRVAFDPSDVVILQD